MKKQLLRFTLSAIIIYLTCGTLNPAVAATQLSVGNGTHVCGVDDQWDKRHSDQYPNRRYARTLAVNLNVGEPRTMRMIYFLPNDRPYRADVVQRMKDEILDIQTFFAEQMDAHGYGKLTFRFETDSQGEPIVHRVDGGHPDSYYLYNPDPMFDEIEQAFDLDANIYLIVIDNSVERVAENAIGQATPIGKMGDGRWFLTNLVGSWWHMNWDTPSDYGTIFAMVRTSCRMAQEIIGYLRARPNFYPCIPTSIPIPQLRKDHHPPSNSFHRVPIRRGQKVSRFDSKSVI